MADEAVKSTADRKTRLVRLDVPMNAVVQIEVPAGLSAEQARERASAALSSAIRRATSDAAVKIDRKADGENFYDPSGGK